MKHPVWPWAREPKCGPNGGLMYLTSRANPDPHDGEILFARPGEGSGGSGGRAHIKVIGV